MFFRRKTKVRAAHLPLSLLFCVCFFFSSTKISFIMRLLIALVFVLGLALQVCGQVASSVSAAAPSATGSGTASATITPTQSYPTPEAPINLDNKCKGHIINICPQWEDPPGFALGNFRLYITAQGSGIVQAFTGISDFSARITNVLPQTLYDVWVQGQDGNGVWSFNSTVVTMTTDPADPKLDPTRDIQGFTCSRTTNPKNNRVAATCSWTPALDAVRQINYKVHCVSPVREPTLVRRRVYGATAAAATSAFFAVHRDIATCTFKARFYYARRATTRHSFTLTF
jgi:hypothetical protein